jgi:hypothetical protein
MALEMTIVLQRLCRDVILRRKPKNLDFLID